MPGPNEQTQNERSVENIWTNRSKAAETADFAGHLHSFAQVSPRRASQLH